MSTERRTVLDLFSGLGGFSSAFEDADGWTVVTADIEEEFDPDICADVRDLGPEDLPEPDVVLASPPCPRFSVACIQKIWHHDTERRPKHLPRKADVAQAIETVFHTLWLVYELQPDWWFMENPQGMLRTFIGEPVDQVHYCQYGGDFKKPTDLWGRHPPMTYRKCSGAPACHVSNPREVNTFRDESRTRAVDSSNSAERAKIPYELSDAIRGSIERAYENPPPEQTTLLARTDGGNGRSLKAAKDRTPDA